MSGESASRKGKAWLLAIGAALGLAIALAGRETVVYTSSDAFCAQACHSHPHATEMWIHSAHYSNKRGVVTHCTDCHLPPGGMAYLTEKARLGADDVFGQLFSDVSKIDWGRKRQLDRVRTFTYDASCTRCHSNLFSAGLSSVAGTLPAAAQATNAEQVREMRIVARRMEAHLYYQRNRDKLRCINCHMFDGHHIPAQTMPRSATGENAQFPLAQAGFQNYTEAVPGSEVKFHMIAVPGGSLDAGSPALGACRERDAGPVRTIAISPFWMGQGTVSRREIAVFLTQRKAGEVAGKKESGAGVTEDVASAYVDWLSHVTGKKYRLPTEEELEYACIAGGTMPAWIQTGSRSVADASADIAELNAWGFMDLPDAAGELTTEAAQNPEDGKGRLDQGEIRFRIVRVPEEKKATSSATIAAEPQGAKSQAAQRSNSSLRLPGKS